MRQIAHSGGLVVSRDLLKISKGAFAARLTHLITALASTGLYNTILNV